MTSIPTTITFTQSTTTENSIVYNADFSMIFWYLGIQITLLVMIFLKLRK